MTTQKLFKRRVRERMSKTGESYTAARGRLAPRRDAVEVTRKGLASARELASDAKLREATGRGWEGWLTVLDAAGARDRKHPETVAILTGEHGVPGWWAQTITNGYERARGLRQKHQQADGFTIYASKTIGVPIDRLFDAFVDPRRRRGWLTDGAMTIRTKQPHRTARFDWDGGATRVLVTFETKGAAKATASVAHGRLPDPDAGEAAKAAWQARLSALKRYLEAEAPTA